MKTIFESRNCIVEYDGNDTVYKTLKQTKISHDWLAHYNQVRDNNPRYVEVYEVIDNEQISFIPLASKSSCFAKKFIPLMG